MVGGGGFVSAGSMPGAFRNGTHKCCRPHNPTKSVAEGGGASWIVYLRSKNREVQPNFGSCGLFLAFRFR